MSELNKKHKDIELSYSIILLFLSESAFRVVSQLIQNNIISTIYILSVLLIFIIIIMKLIKYDIRYFCVIECVFLFLCATSFVRGHSDVPTLLDTTVTALFTCIPAVAAFIAIDDKQILLSRLRKVCPFWALALSCAIVLLHNENSYSDGSAMVLSYSAMLPVLFLVQELLNGFKVLTLCSLIATLVVLIAFGSRGPLLAVVFLLLVESVKKIRRGNARAAIVMLASIISVLIILGNIDTILIPVLDYLKYNNIYYSRNLYYIVNGISFDLSSRGDIWGEALDLFSQSPLYGWGINSAEKLISVNPHNTVLELAVSCGVLGLIPYILVSVSGIILSLTSKDFNNPLRLLLEIFASYSLPFLLIRSYLFTTTGIYLFLAASTMCMREKETQKVETCR
ncbi:O-antigen ligase family protein [Collinsella sp. An271]|uniref:O-antigen ligase family protein n=1 Tax=Collinsella sp. An271 TaxID=1965616 RepID=UPI001302B765|nr:O-antigen ligase family protein [Collinsella sp. An271]